MWDDITVKPKLGKRFKGEWYFKAAKVSSNLHTLSKDTQWALVGNDKVPQCTAISCTKTQARAVPQRENCNGQRQRDH